MVDSEERWGPGSSTREAQPVHVVQGPILEKLRESSPHAHDET